MLLMLRCAGALTFLLACPLTAQRTWVVDRLGRPGSNFADLPPAVAAAASGDTIVVRSGSAYTPFATNKGLTITSEANPAVLSFNGQTQVAITGLPAGEQFTLHNVLLMGNNANLPMVHCSGCEGRVVLNSMVVVSANAQCVDVQSCRAVALQNCNISLGSPAVGAFASRLEITASRIVGGNANDVIGRASSPGLQLLLCAARIEGSWLSGGAGRGPQPPAPALVADHSIIEVGTLDPSDQLASGSIGALGTTNGSPAVAGTASSLRIDGNLAVVPTGSAAPTSGVAVVPGAFPGLAIDPAQNGAVAVAMRVPAGAARVLMLGTPIDPVGVPGIQGFLWVEPTTATLAFAPGSTFPVPPLPKGLTIAAQLATATTAGFELSNVDMFVVR